MAVNGLIIGRTLESGKLIVLPRKRMCHTSIFSPSGGGKGVSYVITTLKSYPQPMFVFDPKGENFLVASRDRRKFGPVYRVDPFNVCGGDGGDCINLLDTIDMGEMLLDDCLAFGDAMVVRPESEENPHWNNAASHAISTCLVAAVAVLKPEVRTLSSMREILTDHDLFETALKQLLARGGHPARMANQILQQQRSEKEYSSIMSTAFVHTQWLDSLMVERTISHSTFSLECLRNAGTIFFVLPAEQMAAQKSFLRIFVSAALRYMMRRRARYWKDCLFMLDEAASLSGLESLAQALQLGRGAGIRLFMAWQTAEQASNGFRNMPNLVSDNSDLKLYFNINSFPTADLVSRMLGTSTHIQESANSSSGSGCSVAGQNRDRGRSANASDGRSWAEVSRPLLFPAEVMQLGDNYVIAFCKGCKPICCRRIFYYRDRLFTWRRFLPRLNWRELFWVLIVLFIGYGWLHYHFKSRW